MADGYLHNVFDAILLYYLAGLRQYEKVVKDANRPKKDDRLPTTVSLGEVDRILRALDNTNDSLSKFQRPLDMLMSKRMDAKLIDQ